METGQLLFSVPNLTTGWVPGQEGGRKHASPAPSLRVPLGACAARGYCSDSGMALTTRAASGAVGGPPKRVLVRFCCCSRR